MPETEQAEILRRLNALELDYRGNGNGHGQERPGVLHRLTTLEVRAKQQDRDEGKLLTAFQELRDIYLLHSKYNDERFSAIDKQIVGAREDIVKVLSLLLAPTVAAVVETKTKKRRKPNGKRRRTSR